MPTPPPQPSEGMPASFTEYAGDLSNVSALLRTGAITHQQAQAMIAAKWGMAPAPIHLEVYEPQERQMRDLLGGPDDETTLIE